MDNDSFQRRGKNLYNHNTLWLNPSVRSPHHYSGAGSPPVLNVEEKPDGFRRVKLDRDLTRSMMLRRLGGDNYSYSRKDRRTLRGPSGLLRRLNATRTSWGDLGVVIAGHCRVPAGVCSPPQGEDPPAVSSSRPGLDRAPIRWRESHRQKDGPSG